MRAGKPGATVQTDNKNFLFHKMNALIKSCIVLLMYHLITRNNAVIGEIILTDDRPYDTIDIKIPRVVWNQALRPTPVLKSTVTVILPIHVQSEDENEIDEEIEDEVTPISDTSENVQVQNEEVSASSPAVPDVTVAPVQQAEESTSTPEQVPGQVIRFPCSCISGQCGCCTGAILERFRMKACGNITFVPEDFVFDVRMSVNNNTVVRQRVSASDPPPICFNPRRAPFVRVCAEISNIRIRNRNAFACLDINADIAGFPVYTASFRCFGLGASGVQTGLKPKPASSGPAPVSLFGNNDDDGGSFIENAAGAILGGVGDGGIFGGGADADGPLDAIGDAVGDFFDGRKL